MMGYTLIVCLALLAGNEALHISGNHNIKFYKLQFSHLHFNLRGLWFTTGGSSDSQNISVIYGRDPNARSTKFAYGIHTFSQKRQHAESCSIYMDNEYKLNNLIGTDVVSNDKSGLETLVFVASSSSRWAKHVPKQFIVTMEPIIGTGKCNPREIFSTHGLINAVRTSDDENIYDIVVKKRGGYKTECYFDDDDECDIVSLETITTCGNDGDCVIRSLDLKSNEVSEAKPFVVNLNWTGLSFERLNDQELLVYGMNNEHEFKWLRFDRSTGQSREMLSLLGFSGKEKILHSGLTFCWINNQGVDMTVDCSRLDADDQLAAAKTVFFKKSVNLLFVHATTRNEILIVTSTLKEKPEENSTWSYNATKIRKDGSFTKPMDLPLPCVNLPTFSNAKYNAYENEVSFQYVCKQDNGFYHNEISIAMRDY